MNANYFPQMTEEDCGLCTFLDLPYYRKLTLHEIKVLEINAT